MLKREPLWDPCLDVVGQRFPNVFVRRGSGGSAQEIEAVRSLAQDLVVGKGVLIYPEGTRFTPAKQQRVLDVLARRGDPDRLAAARSLTHLLPRAPKRVLRLDTQRIATRRRCLQASGRRV